MSDKKYTIEDLFSDKGAFNEHEIAKAIYPFVTIQKDTNEIFFKSNELSTDEKILTYGLAKKLLKVKGCIESEMITAIELHRKTGIKKGTIDPTFKNLKESGYIVGKREYEIPLFKVSEIIDMINKKSNGED